MFTQMKSWVKVIFPSGVVFVLPFAYAVAIVGQAFTMNTYIESEMMILNISHWDSFLTLARVVSV